MRPNWPKLASKAQKTCALDSFQFFGVILASKDNLFIQHIQYASAYRQLCPDKT